MAERLGEHPIADARSGLWSRSAKNCWIRATPASTSRGSGQSSCVMQSSTKRRSARSKRLGLAERDLVGVQRAGQHAVEHDLADLVGEQFCVLGAQEGAVALAEEVQLLVAEDRAQDVHVARRGLGVHVRGNPGRSRLAAHAEQLRLRGQIGDLLRRVRRAVRGEEGVDLGVIEAVHRV